MVNKKIKMNEKNEDGSFNILHPETTIEQVINPSGDSLIDHFSDKTKKHIEIVNTIPTNLVGKGVFFEKQNETPVIPGKPTIQDVYDKVDETKVLLTGNIQEIHNKVDHQYINILSPPPPLTAAKGDGVTNDYIAIQEALDTGLSVYLPYTPNGYVIDDVLIVITGQILFGNNKQTKIIQTTNNLPIIRVIGSHFKIHNLHLYYKTQQNDTTSGGVGIELGDASTSEGAYEGTVENVIIERSYRGIAIPTWMGNAFAFMNTFNQIRVLNSWDFGISLNSNVIGLTTNTLMNVYVLHNQINYNPNGGKGFLIGNHDDFIMGNCAVDHALGEALRLENNRSGTILSFHAEGCHLKGDWASMVTVVNSNIKFNSLQFPYNIVDPLVINEAYFVHAYQNSTVIMDFMTIRDTNVVGAGYLFSVVASDGTSTVNIGKLTSPYPTILSPIEE